MIRYKHKKKDVCFLCQFFYPDNVSSATLPFDTAKYLAQKKYTVGAVCGYPKEYTAKKQFPCSETVDDVSILRVKYMQLKRKKTISRLVNYFSFTIKVIWKIRELKQYKVVIVYSNPPILPAAAVLAKKLYGTKIVFVAYDVYPEMGYATGSIREGGLIDKTMLSINTTLYKNADKVIALTDEMKNFLIEHRKELSSERITTIANWAHEELSEAEKKTYESLEIKENSFVVSYFGNMGICQDMQTILDAAYQLRNQNIVFLLVGHGNKKEYIKCFVRKHDLNNVKVIEYLTGKKFENALAVTSCFVLTLEKGLIGTCAPSKYYSYLQGGRPILAVAPKGSYLEEEIKCYQIGEFVKNGDSSQMVSSIIGLASNKEQCESMGKRARTLYETKYLKKIALKKYEDVIKDVIS